MYQCVFVPREGVSLAQDRLTYLRAKGLFEFIKGIMRRVTTLPPLWPFTVLARKVSWLRVITLSIVDFNRDDSWFYSSVLQVEISVLWAIKPLKESLVKKKCFFNVFNVHL